MSPNAPFLSAPDRRCYVVYVGEDAPIELHGTKSEVKREAERRMDALRDAHSTSLRTKLRNLPIRRKGSVATTATGDEASTVSRINLLDLPTEILDVILGEVGVKNFYEDPARLAVCKKWHRLARRLMVRNVELDVNSLVRVVTLARRPSLVRKILTVRRGSTASTISSAATAADDEYKVGLRLGEIQHFDADLRIINGFRTKNHVPIERHSNYKGWKSDVDSSFAWLASHAHELATVRSFRLRAWTAHCAIAERKDKQWQRLARDTVGSLLRSPSVLDRVELDFCGTDFMWIRCGWTENSSACVAVAALLLRVRSLRLRLQSMCPTALQLPDDATDLRLEELIVNRDTSEAHPWSQSGPQAGICMRPEGLVGPGNQEIVRAMRRLIPRLRAPQRVRFLWMFNKFELDYDPTVKLPLNKEGKVAYTGSMAYDLLTEKVQRMGFLAPWDAEGKVIKGCNGHLWEEEPTDGQAAAG